MTLSQTEQERDLPLISIVTPVYNRADTVERTVRSVLTQDYPRVEYILMDGGSTDGTVAVAEAYRAAFAERGYSLIIRSAPDDGMYDALNRGVALASGDIIGQINADDYYEPGALARVAEAFGRTHFDYFYADLRVVKPNGSFIKRARYKRMPLSRYWNHPTTFIRADVYRSHPYALESMYDDFELLLRLRREGYRAVVCNEVLASFSFGGMSTKKSWRSVRERIACRRAIYRKHGYGFLYTLDSILTEVLKYLWG